MSHAIKLPLSFDGAHVSATIGAARIRVERLSATVFYVETRHSGPAGVGPVVAELSRSWPTEAQARTAARGLYRAFHAGLSVAAVIADLTAVVDAALARAFQGGDGTGRGQTAIPALDELRESLRSPGERVERQARLQEMADLIAASAPRDPLADQWA
ncbi:MAG TPA: hypothetical protein VJT31_27835, partial [Rugosimonospora sp.]|nr:hypothetical protein [Rugosimonospora sp.]